MAGKTVGKPVGGTLTETPLPQFEVVCEDGQKGSKGKCGNIEYEVKKEGGTAYIKVGKEKKPVGRDPGRATIARRPFWRPSEYGLGLRLATGGMGETPGKDRVVPGSTTTIPGKTVCEPIVCPEGMSEAYCERYKASHGEICHEEPPTTVTTEGRTEAGSPEEHFEGKITAAASVRARPLEGSGIPVLKDICPSAEIEMGLARYVVDHRFEDGFTFGGNIGLGLQFPNVKGSGITVEPYVDAAAMTVPGTFDFRGGIGAGLRVSYLPDDAKAGFAGSVGGRGNEGFTIGADRVWETAAYDITIQTQAELLLEDAGMWIAQQDARVAQFEGGVNELKASLDKAEKYPEEFKSYAALIAQMRAKINESKGRYKAIEPRVVGGKEITAKAALEADNGYKELLGTLKAVDGREGGGLLVDATGKRDDVKKIVRVAVDFARLDAQFTAAKTRLDELEKKPGVWKRSLSESNIAEAEYPAVIGTFAVDVQRAKAVVSAVEAIRSETEAIVMGRGTPVAVLKDREAKVSEYKKALEPLIGADGTAGQLVTLENGQRSIEQQIIDQISKVGEARRKAGEALGTLNAVIAEIDTYRKGGFYRLDDAARTQQKKKGVDTLIQELTAAAKAAVDAHNELKQTDKAGEISRRTAMYKIVLEGDRERAEFERRVFMLKEVPDLDSKKGYNDKIEALKSALDKFTGVGERVPVMEALGTLVKEVDAAIKANAKAKEEAEAKAKAKAEVKAEAKVEAEAKAKAEVKAEVKAEAKVEAEAKAKAKAEVKAEVKAEAKEEAVPAAEVEKAAAVKEVAPPAEAVPPAGGQPAQGVAPAEAAPAADAQKTAIRGFDGFIDGTIESAASGKYRTETPEAMQARLAQLERKFQAVVQALGGNTTEVEKFTAQKDYFRILLLAEMARGGIEKSVLTDGKIPSDISSWFSQIDNDIKDVRKSTLLPERRARVEKHLVSMKADMSEKVFYIVFADVLQKLLTRTPALATDDELKGLQRLAGQAVIVLNESSAGSADAGIAKRKADIDEHYRMIVAVNAFTDLFFDMLDGKYRPKAGRESDVPKLRSAFNVIDGMIAGMITKGKDFRGYQGYKDNIDFYGEKVAEALRPAEQPPEAPAAEPAPSSGVPAVVPAGQPAAGPQGTAPAGEEKPQKTVDKAEEARLAALQAEFDKKYDAVAAALNFFNRSMAHIRQLITTGQYRDNPEKIGQHLELLTGTYNGVEGALKAMEGLDKNILRSNGIYLDAEGNRLAAQFEMYKTLLAFVQDKGHLELEKRIITGDDPGRAAIKDLLDEMDDLSDMFRSIEGYDAIETAVKAMKKAVTDKDTEYEAKRKMLDGQRLPEKSAIGGMDEPTLKALAQGLEAKFYNGYDAALKTLLKENKRYQPTGYSEFAALGLKTGDDIGYFRTKAEGLYYLELTLGAIYKKLEDKESAERIKSHYDFIDELDRDIGVFLESVEGSPGAYKIAAGKENNVTELAGRLKKRLGSLDKKGLRGRETYRDTLHGFTNAMITLGGGRISGAGSTTGVWRDVPPELMAKPKEPWNGLGRRVKGCYDRLLKKDPEMLEGSIKVQINVDANGNATQVRFAEDEIGNPELADQIFTIIATTDYPEEHKGRKIRGQTVAKPFRFRKTSE